MHGEHIQHNHCTAVDSQAVSLPSAPPAQLSCALPSCRPSTSMQQLSCVLCQAASHQHPCSSVKHPLDGAAFTKVVFALCDDRLTLALGPHLPADVAGKGEVVAIITSTLLSLLVTVTIRVPALGEGLLAPLLLSLPVLTGHSTAQHSTASSLHRVCVCLGAGGWTAGICEGSAGRDT